MPPVGLRPSLMWSGPRGAPKWAIGAQGSAVGLPSGEGLRGSIEEQSADCVGEPPFVAGGAPAAIAGQAVVDGGVHEQPYLVDRVAAGDSRAEGGAVADAVDDPGDGGGALGGELT